MYGWIVKGCRWTYNVSRIMLVNCIRINSEWILWLRDDCGWQIYPTWKASKAQTPSIVIRTSKVVHPFKHAPQSCHIMALVLSASSSSPGFPILGLGSWVQVVRTEIRSVPYEFATQMSSTPTLSETEHEYRRDITQIRICSQNIHINTVP